MKVKTLLLTFFAFLLSMSVKAQTNVGFAEAAGLTPTVVCYSFDQAMARYIQAAESPLLGPIYADIFTYAWSRKGKTYGGVQNYQFTPKDVITIFKWVKSNPGDAGKYGIIVYEFPPNTPLYLGTLTKSANGWIPGVPLNRSSFPGEFGLDVWEYFAASSRCLNINPVREEVSQPADVGLPPAQPGMPGVAAVQNPTGGGTFVYVINSANNGGGYAQQPQPQAQSLAYQPPAPEPQPQRKNNWLGPVLLGAATVGAIALLGGNRNKYGSYSGYGYQQQGHPVGCVCNTCQLRYQQPVQYGQHPYGCSCSICRPQSNWGQNYYPQTDSYYQFVSGGQTGFPGPPPPGWPYSSGNFGGW